MSLNAVVMIYLGFPPLNPLQWRS